MSDEKFPKIKAGGWKTQSTRCVYENPWIKVSHEEVTAPGGSEGIYGVIHFKNTAIGVIPLDEAGNTWLVKQSRYTLNAYTWEIPEGGCPANENPLDAAKRELEEEVGLCAKDLKPLLEMHLSNSVTDERCLVFVARDLYPGVQQLEATEDIEVKKLPLHEAIAMVKRGEITDAVSVGGLLRLAIELD